MYVRYSRIYTRTCMFKKNQMLLSLIYNWMQAATLNGCMYIDKMFLQRSLTLDAADLSL